MKSFSIFLLIIITNVTLAQQPQIARVSITNITTIYTNLKTAMNEAQDDDIIYLSGGTYTIDSLNFRKKVHVIGTGHYPDSTTVTNISKIVCNVYLLQGCNNSAIQGVYLNGKLLINHLKNSNFTLSKSYVTNEISYTPTAQNDSLNGIFFIKESILITGLRGSGALRYDVRNSIFQNNGVDYVYNPYNGGIAYYCLLGINNSTFTNCIFSNQSYINSANCSFTNNVFYSDIGLLFSNFNTNIFNYNLFTNSTTPQIMGAQSEIGNLAESGLAQTFNNVSTPNFNYAFDYHLKGNSIGNTISGGVGIYAGTASYNPNPINPHIYFKAIPPASNTQGQLQIQFKVKAQ